MIREAQENRSLLPESMHGRLDAVADRAIAQCRRVYGSELVAVFLIGSYATARARSDRSTWTVFPRSARSLEAVDRWVEENGITRVPHKGGYYWRGIPTQ